MSAIKAVFHVGLSTFAKLAGALVCIKVVAIYLGPQGLGLLGNFMSAVSILMAVSCGAVSLGITRYVAEFKNRPRDLKLVLSTSSAIVVVSCILLSFVVLAFAEQISIALFKSADFAQTLRLSTIFFLPIGFTTLGLAVLNGFSETVGLAKVQIGAALLSSSGLFLFVYFGSVKGALLGLLWVPACVLFFLIYWLFKSRFVFFTDLKPVLDRHMSTLLLRYALMMLVTVSCQNFAQVVIRGWVGEAQGWEAVGYWQAMSRTSDAYLQLFNAFLVAYFLPKISQQRDPAAALKTLYSTYKFIAPLLLLTLVVGFFCRDFVIHLLFASEFYPVRALFLPQMIADFFKVLAFLPGYLVISRGYIPLLLIGDPIQIALLLLISPFFITQFGVLGACIAAAVTYALYLAISMLCLAFYQKRINRV
jgi:O-antigen/teichoic acid export membrane protein